VQVQEPALLRGSYTGAWAGRRRRLAGRAALFLFLALVGVLFLLPFYWMIISSIRPVADYFNLPMPIIPQRLSLENYQKLFARTLFLRGMANTAFLAIVSVITQVFCCALAGYTFAKLRFKGRDPLFIGILATMMVPAGVGMIPNYIMMSRLHWINTYWPLIVPGVANAFGIFWMRQYCLSVPDELIDAARIDGAGEFAIFWRIILPIISPALASLAIFVFLGTWNEFLGPLVYLRSSELFTVQLWLSVVSQLGEVKQPFVVMAGAVLASVPILVMFVTLQRYFVSGLTLGSIK